MSPKIFIMALLLRNIRLLRRPIRMMLSKLMRKPRKN